MKGRTSLEISKRDLCGLGAVISSVAAYPTRKPSEMSEQHHLYFKL